MKPVEDQPALAIDLGGTKTLVALVRGDRCFEVERITTELASGPEGWLDAVAACARVWNGRFATAAIAVSGLVAEGRWWSLNPLVLPIPPAFPIEDALSARLGVPVAAANDAQAAAWGEHRFGAGRGQDLVFLTISTGIGGGIVLDGRLVTGGRGLAGHVGRMLTEDSPQGPRLEDLASGGALARVAAALGHRVDAVAIFKAAAEGQAWAESLVAGSAERVARSLASLQMLIDPSCFVIGGGVGLAPGYVERVQAALTGLPDIERPVVRRAALGPQAGLVGIADYARLRFSDLKS